MRVLVSLCDIMSLFENDTAMPLTKEQLEELICKIQNKSHRLMIIIGASSGITSDELKQITPDTINYPNQIINIWDKNQNRHRSVYFSENVLKLIKEYEGINWNTDGNSFFPFSSQTIELLVKKYCEEILNLNRRWLCIRRSFVSLAADANLDIGIVVENSGGKIADVYKYYQKKGIDPIKEINNKPLFNVLQRKLNL